jgi:hypothetical protein
MCHIGNKKNLCISGYTYVMTLLMYMEKSINIYIYIYWFVNETFCHLFELFLLDYVVSCMLCEQFISVTIILTCDQCYRDWHMGCLMSPLGEVLVGKLFYLRCP